MNKVKSFFFFWEGTKLKVKSAILTKINWSTELSEIENKKIELNINKIKELN